MKRESDPNLQRWTRSDSESTGVLSLIGFGNVKENNDAHNQRASLPPPAETDTGLAPPALRRRETVDEPLARSDSSTLAPPGHLFIPQAATRSVRARTMAGQQERATLAAHEAMAALRATQRAGRPR